MGHDTSSWAVYGVSVLALSLGLGYLIGSVNFAVIVARRHGVDILSAGSGNPGATNVKRVIGKTAGNLVFLLDALKGAVGSVLGCLIMGGSVLGTSHTSGQFLVLAAGFVGTLLGHCFSCFLKFKGGKGVASTIGGLLVLLPIPIAIGATLWAVTFFTTRYVSVASIVLGLSLPVSCWMLPHYTAVTDAQDKFWFAAAIAAFNVWTHRSNIARLLRGEESRFTRKEPQS